MYALIKSYLKSIFPSRVLFRYEPLFRSVFALAYRGNTYQCNICNTRLHSFIKLDNGDQLCPQCGSLARNRRLWEILQTGLLRPGISVLDFSPSRCLYRAMKAQKDITYISTDISGDFLADRRYDITRIDAPDHSYDLIICYHVLEHVEADRQAMQELRRVLRPGGTCLVQTPFKEGAIYEDPAIREPAARLAHFGQEDHVRIYSVAGLKQRLEAAGFSAAVKKFGPEPTGKNGFTTGETVLWLTPLMASEK